MRFDEYDPNEYEQQEPRREHTGPSYPYEEYYGGSGGKKRGPGKWIAVVVVLCLVAGGAWLIKEGGQLITEENHMEWSFRLPWESEVQTQVPEEQQQAPLEEEKPQTTIPEKVEGTTSLQISPKPVPQVPSEPASEEGVLSLQAIYKKVIPSVVSVMTSSNRSSGTGTGIIMSQDGYVITNEHVVNGAQQIQVLLHDESVCPATLVGSDEASDLAVLRIEQAGLIPAEFGDSELLEVGDDVVAIGDPLGIQLRGTMTDGIISAINRDLTIQNRTMTLIQTNAALNSGNSGGPLINDHGQVIGITALKLSSVYSATIEGLGFAIPISTAKPIVDELIEKGYVSGRPALGITADHLPAAVRVYYRLPEGVYVSGVDPDSDAYQKGVAEGDIIVAINGTPVATRDQLEVVKNQFVAGDTVTLTIFRAGQQFDVDVVLVDQAGQASN